ncbi:hemerythrin domain-containing protein [Gayadomonas joobiniege]|uniref:hemerythrin domain-containing protein n=1 Tax=Gayadomonas joobiniege TaxID=1234606 RepID=UPI00036D78C2|nr:hemerythrin domain-containing protein [Gayadomonas joobiniege]
MSIYTYLKDDHKKIKALLQSIEDLGPQESQQRDECFNDLKKTLILHSKAEEKVFYKPLKKSADTQNEVEHGEEEHQEAELLMRELTSERLTGNAWYQKFLKLKSDLEHHIEEEEEDIFADAQAVLSDKKADKMEKSMRKAKKEEQQKRSISERHFSDSAH